MVCFHHMKDGSDQEVVERKEPTAATVDWQHLHYYAISEQRSWSAVECMGHLNLQYFEEVGEGMKIHSKFGVPANKVTVSCRTRRMEKRNYKWKA